MSKFDRTLTSLAVLGWIVLAIGVWRAWLSGRALDGLETVAVCGGLLFCAYTRIKFLLSALPPSEDPTHG